MGAQAAISQSGKCMTKPWTKAINFRILYADRTQTTDHIIDQIYLLIIQLNRIFFLYSPTSLPTILSVYWHWNFNDKNLKKEKKKQISWFMRGIHILSRSAIVWYIFSWHGRHLNRRRNNLNWIEALYFSDLCEPFSDDLCSRRYRIQQRLRQRTATQAPHTHTNTRATGMGTSNTKIHLTKPVFDLILLNILKKWDHFESWFCGISTIEAWPGHCPSCVVFTYTYT